MPQILIDRKTCSKCNTCATVCVMGIIDKSTALNHPTIPEEKLDYCLKCGHCESFCAQKALTLDFLLDEKINTSFLDSQIEPQNIALYIKSRRSVRHYSSKTVNLQTKVYW